MPADSQASRWSQVCPILQAQEEVSSLTCFCPNPVNSSSSSIRRWSPALSPFLSLEAPVSVQLFKQKASAPWGLLTVLPEMLIGIRAAFKQEAG